MNILILDDDNERMEHFRDKLKGHDLYTTELSNVAIDLLKCTKFDFAFLDHSLGGQAFAESGPGTGYEVATFLEENDEYVPDFIVIHSFDVGAGAESMFRALIKYRVCKCPGIWLDDDLPEMVEDLKFFEVLENKQKLQYKR